MITLLYIIKTFSYRIYRLPCKHTSFILSPGLMSEMANSFAKALWQRLMLVTIHFMVFILPCFPSWIAILTSRGSNCCEMCAVPESLWLIVMNAHKSGGYTKDGVTSCILHLTGIFQSVSHLTKFTLKFNFLMWDVLFVLLLEKAVYMVQIYDDLLCLFVLYPIHFLLRKSLYFCSVSWCLTLNGSRPIDKMSGHELKAWNHCSLLD